MNVVSVTFLTIGIFQQPIGNLKVDIEQLCLELEINSFLVRRCLELDFQPSGTAIAKVAQPVTDEVEGKDDKAKVNNEIDIENFFF